MIDHLLQRITLGAHAARHPSAELADPLTGELVQIPYDPFAVFVAGAIIDWLRRDRPETPVQMAAAIWPLLQARAASNGHDR